MRPALASLVVIAAFAHGPATRILFFITTDCPISNFYAPEIQSICRGYRGVSCQLVYEDLNANQTAVRRHASEYKYGDIPATIDSRRVIAVRFGATVTPEAVVIDAHGSILYRGRIDNFYAAIGRPRRQATERDVRRALDAVFAGKPVANPQTTPIGCSMVPPSLPEGK